MQTMSSGLQWWFESMDHARKRRGVAMEQMGYAPVETASDIVLTAPGFRLRHYRGNGTSEHVALIVPAPIKRHYIWDLAPECSVVQRAIDAGLQVYLVEWTEPGAEEASFGLEQYAFELLDQCVAVIRKQHANGSFPRISLFSHSLGGILAAIYTALRPEYVASLVLIEAPLHFPKDQGAFGPLVAFGPKASQVTSIFGRVPGSLLNLASVMASPSTFGSEPYADLMASLDSPVSMRSHFRVQRWMLDEASMSPALFQDVVDQLYRGDAFMQGSLVIAGRAVSPISIVAPVLAVYDPRSRIIPPAAMTGFVKATSSATKRLLTYDGDTGVTLAHVGALVGESAHRRIWPEILQWAVKVDGTTH
ncbi:alpha/beta hydrolase [Noviherbaspirillum saxi]|uniref:PHA synthase subunit PhaC n=1 Tax=Noviherbaspirillum saxi TaxID=2320863 RepID=A0A3A3GC81_9BURK|nr:alpha/beta hydrolase [Noviherbaspirillum saxi]RJF98499.1 PHA synthase subunit PhaC [Noviherbaspirillum saxi]